MKLKGLHRGIECRSISFRSSRFAAAHESTQNFTRCRFRKGEMSGALKEKPVVRFLNDLRRSGGLKGIDIANVTDVSKATVSRWANGRKSPHPRTQLLLSDLHYVVMRLSEYYSAEEIRAWLYARHTQLNGERAIDLIHENRSEEVLSILDRLDADAYL